MDWSSFINKSFRLYTRLINFILTKDERLIQNMKVIIFKWGYVEKDIIYSYRKLFQPMRLVEW